ncbi:MAG: tetratricopeptide repeat protein, partial [Bacteroidetes bacterium]|nr:tetratricopeptide repeat protein [Bacteroidota bacterium]
RPGMKLSDYMTTFLPRYKGADDQFIMASHADRLKQSKCFINSFNLPADQTAPSARSLENNSNLLRPYKNALTCVTCHNPHVSVKVTGKEIFNNACKNCHSSADQIHCSETMVNRQSSIDNCVSCHMPKSGSIDIPHVTVHDHFIRKPMKKEEINKVKEFIGLYAVNEKNPDNTTKAKAYIQQYDKFESNPEFLDSAKKYLSDKTQKDIEYNFENLIHLYFIKKDYTKILGYVNQLGKENILKNLAVKKSWDNVNAWTLYRIGESYYNTGNISDAYTFYKNAEGLSPYNLEFKNKLGTVLMAQNKIAEAILIFESILKEYPKFIQAINNLGYANLASGNAMQAEILYDRALKLDPDYEALLMNIAGLSIYKKDYKKAEQFLRDVLKRNPENDKAKQVMKQLKSTKY